MGTHQIVLSKSFPMNTMAGFKKVSKYFCDFVLLMVQDKSIASVWVLKGLITSNTFLFDKCSFRILC